MNNMERAEIIVGEMIGNIPGDTLADKLAYCASCDCCERHTIDRPSVLAPFVNPVTQNRENIDYDFRCNCICRHAARFICRKYTHMSTIKFNECNYPTGPTGITEDAF